LAATIVVIAMFWGHRPALRAITEAGVLELAWLFVRQPEEFKPLLEVKKPTPAALRKAGQRIMWKGVFSDEHEMA
jgi:hypothetical protein